jgi:hypothetical protein
MIKASPLSATRRIPPEHYLSFYFFNTCYLLFATQSPANIVCQLAVFAQAPFPSVLNRKKLAYSVFVMVIIPVLITLKKVPSP